jgi:hypothetical protein
MGVTKFAVSNDREATYFVVPGQFVSSTPQPTNIHTLREWGAGDDTLGRGPWIVSCVAGGRGRGG